jgi:predicted ATPase
MTTMRMLADALRLREIDRSSLFASAQIAEPAAPLLPAFADAFVDREGELDALSQLADRADVRLITMVGPAGVGKTRIAVAYAAQRAATYPDGVHWMPVGALVDASSVLPAMAGALGVHGSPQPTVAEIVDHLRTRSGLLMIDNAEHQLEECSTICRALLAGAPAIKIILTSRHLTNLPGELAFDIRPLGLPSYAADSLTTAPASQLFVTRAGLGA